MAIDDEAAAADRAERPESAGEALARARMHARRAAGEAVAALRALIDAATLTLEGAEGAGSRLSALNESLDRLRDWLEGDAASQSVLDSVDQALGEEIARWEERSREEPEARIVLRAFLAVREVIFELRAAQHAPRRPTDPPPRRRRRVQRVPVQG